MKCFKCKGEFNYLEQFGKNKYCSDCYQEVKTEDVERKKLIMTICDVYNLNQPTGFMFAQMKRMKEKNGWYYRNMRLTLRYVVDILKFKPDSKYGLSIIEYHYDDMLSYYKQMSRKQQKNKSIRYKTKEIITTKPTLINKDYKQHKMKDLSKYGR